ncbi:MAG: glycosidase, partial [Rhodanobacter sp.]
SPASPWERVKIGGGAPPVRVEESYVVVYHGVSDMQAARASEVSYAAGLLLLDAENPRRIAYRSKEPVLTARMPEERYGTVQNVVFPTGVDVRTDIGRPRRVDIYYGMADFRIGVATLDMPERLPSGASSDPVAGCV